jgi:hypothetical protein
MPPPHDGSRAQRGARRDDKETQMNAPGSTVLRRGLATVAAATALGIAASAAASAHECYRDTWLGGSYDRVASGTPWTPLSDLGVWYLIGPEYAQQCGYVADEAVTTWMASKGLEEEPLVHGRATVGGGAEYYAGREPRPFSYLGEEDFFVLTMLVVDGMATCAPEWELPA